MAVVLPNAQMRVRARAHPAERDAHGTPVLGPPAAARGPYDAGIKDGPDQRDEVGVLWSIRLDPAAWPLELGDTLVEALPDGTDGREWVVSSARLHQVVGVPDVDYVAVSATLEPRKVP